LIILFFSALFFKLKLFKFKKIFLTLMICFVLFKLYTDNVAKIKVTDFFNENNNINLSTEVYKTSYLVAKNAIFYKPLNKVLDERADYIRNNQEDAKQRLAKAQELTKQYEQQIADARRQSQEVIATAQADARRLAADKIAEAQREAQQQKETAAQEIEQQRQSALSSLEQQVDGLSRQILEKLLGPELVR
jgi:F-type H+-transporting ATPase subunit b